eukprot:SAG11_NODE_1844_length_4178_cov_4.716842_1_plen_152_part_00
MSSTPWEEKDALLKEEWEEPGKAEGEDLEGLCIFVQGLGKGTVLAFNKSKLGGSSHTVDFGADPTKVTLERKGKGTPYLILSAGANGMTDADVDPEPELADAAEDLSKLDSGVEREEEDDDDDDYDDETEEDDDDDIAILPKRSQSVEWEG